MKNGNGLWSIEILYAGCVRRNPIWIWQLVGRAPGWGITPTGCVCFGLGCLLSRLVRDAAESADWWYEERVQSSKTRSSQPILRALEPSCQSSSANEFYHQTVVKSWKKTTVHLSQLPNSPQTSTLHNTFYFNNTWTKIQLWSDPVNMQPDKT